MPSILRKFGISAAMLFLFLPAAYPAMEDDDLDFLLREIHKSKPEEKPVENLYTKNDILYCTGDTEAAELNNRAASLMEAGDHAGAKKLLDAGLIRAPLFLPYLYNTGLCCLHLNQLDQSIIYLEKARDLLPEFSKTYLQLGFVYQVRKKYTQAIDNFKLAIRTNRKELMSLILIGDIYFNSRQVQMAGKYYNAALKIDPRYPNGLLGLAKIHYFKKEYGRALNAVKAIDISGEYDKALHYYHAECSYKLQDYKTAYEQYGTLLKYPGDKFFILFSTSLIRHKMELAERFIKR
jgi:tetratricopeptide (TPR) repeat protein